MIPERIGNGEGHSDASLPGADHNAGGEEERMAGEMAFSAAVQARLFAAMREAIAEAMQAQFAVGAVLLDAETGRTVFRAHNTTGSGDPPAHAEVNALRGAGPAGIDLARTVLITSAESCPM